MSVIQYIPREPTDLVIPGEQMRQSVFDPVDLEQPEMMMGSYVQTALQSIVQDEDAFGPMNSFICASRLSAQRSKNGTLRIWSGAGIATPCGAWVSFDWPPLLVRFEQASVLWSISGTTKNSTGTALADCDVVAFQTWRQPIDGFEAEIARTTSDGSGAYSIPVPTNQPHQLTAYKAGGTDVAGITRNDVTPSEASTSIFLRDPTVADSAGAAVFRPVGSPVIRRIGR